jgi:hypothetical protein
MDGVHQIWGERVHGLNDSPDANGVGIGRITNVADINIIIAG